MGDSGVFGSIAKHSHLSYGVVIRIFTLNLEIAPVRGEF
jgi:hypothetical protein